MSSRGGIGESKRYATAQQATGNLGVGIASCLCVTVCRRCSAGAGYCKFIIAALLRCSTLTFIRPTARRTPRLWACAPAAWAVPVPWALQRCRTSSLSAQVSSRCWYTVCGAKGKKLFRTRLREPSILEKTRVVL